MLKYILRKFIYNYGNKIHYNIVHITEQFAHIYV